MNELINRISQFVSSNIDNYAVEFSASLVGWLLSIVVVSWFSARRKRKQFYTDLQPVMKTLSMVRTETNIDARYIQVIVQSISESFNDHFLKKRWFDITSIFKSKTMEKAECWVCDENEDVLKLKNKCTDCNFDCKAWEKNYITRQEEIERKLLAIKNN